MNKNSSLTKTCSNCGLEKPLSAYLQIAGPEGTMYGNLCASCRGGKADKARVAKEPGEKSSTDSTGFKIDVKSKQKSDRDKVLFHKEKEEKEIKEHEKLKDEALQKTDKTDKKLSLERKHRENFLNTRAVTLEKAESQKTAAPAGKEALQAAAASEEKTVKDAVAKEELQAKGHQVVYGQTELPSQTGMLLKNQGVAFQSWLRGVVGPNAAMAKAFGVDKLINQPKTAKPAAEKTPDVEEEKDLKTHINETFKRGR